MLVKDLIKLLKEFDPNKPIEIGYERLPIKEVIDPPEIPSVIIVGGSYHHQSGKVV